MTLALSHRLRAAGALLTVAFGIACAGGADRTLAPDVPSKPMFATAAAARTDVVISQVYGGGGNSGATLKNDFIELFNPGTEPVSLAGWSVQYASAAGSTWQVTNLTGTIQPGGYYLVQEAAGTAGTVNLPTPDATGTIPMSGTAGKVWLVRNTTVLSGTCPTGTNVVDQVSFGTTASVCGTFGTTPTLSNTTAAIRNASGCAYTANLAADFSVAAPAPRNSASPTTTCDVVVQPVPASVTVTPATATVSTGGTQQLTAKAFDASSQEISGVVFTWTSGNPAVATVNASGLVTAGSTAGTATITATTPNGKFASAELTVVAAPPAQATNVRVTEFHYDNDGTDANEQIELEGDAGGSLAGWKLVLYSGSTGSSTQGQSYGTIELSGTFGAACGMRGVLVVAAPGLQNGDKDGFALVNATGQVVEFLSYEGSFQAVNGPAAGMTATDVGVDEDPAPAAGRSLQRAGNGVWFGPYTSSFGACNAATPPPPQTGVTFSGRLSGDPALPVGFQDQVFATLRDANTGATIPTTFTWSSDTPGIMSVDARGVVTALAVGTGVIRATAADGTTGTVSLSTETPVFGNAALYGNHLAFGTPADATPGDELRVTRDQYVLSYSQARNNANWVAYRLTKANRGDLPGYRCDCFSVDPLVTPPGEAGISTADYTGSGFDRGHLVRSNDRELARGDQATTYYMSNIVPQYANMNQGRWADLESYLQTVVEGAGLPDVYIYTGARGNAGTIAGGRVVVPSHTWKVAVVLPAGMTPASVTKRSDLLDVIAVDVPNLQALPRDGNWQAHRVSVDSVEKATGYDLLSALPNTIEEIIESGDRAPTAALTGPGLAGGSEGQTLAFSAATSTDPDVGGPLGDVLSYQWDVDGAVAGVGASLNHSFTDNGTYVVRVIVADKFGLADTASASVTIANVPPSVAAFAGATILRGESYQANGSFTDPGADTWTATVNYGDGTGTQALALSGKSFQLSHAYAAAGTYTVTVTVGDDDSGTATRTAVVVVKSPGEGVAELATMVAGLVDAGVLTSAEGGSLTAKLDAAAKQFAADRPSAVNLLQAFMNEVAALQGSGRLSATEAGRLTAYAQRVIRSAGG